MKRLIFYTNNSYGPVILRVLLSIVLFPHGAQKLLGLFGGPGFQGTMVYFTDGVGLPWLAGFLVIVIEFFGPVFLLLGFATRLWSIGILCVMTGIIITTFNQFFFMNWYGTQPAEGYEFFLLMIGMSLSLIVSGSGQLSLDAVISEREKSRSREVLRLFEVRA